MEMNSKQYWENRFHCDWEQVDGRKQTAHYAKINILQMRIDPEFNGKLLDFGCALGDAIPVYKKAFPKAKLIGMDISDEAIKRCDNLYREFAEFQQGTYLDIPKVDLIVASHILEHIPNDRLIVKHLLSKCKELFVFVPYKEDPLYFEHVNVYDENYYGELAPYKYKIFKKPISFQYYLKHQFVNTIRLISGRTKQKLINVIMFHFSNER